VTQQTLPGPSTAPQQRSRTRIARAVLGARLRSEGPFVVALGLGVVVRVLVQAAFWPGFLFSDGPTYLWFVDNLRPSPNRPIGYSVLLWAISPLTDGVDAITILQHVLGLATAVVLYVVLRRWGVSTWVATLAVLPVLFDQLQLTLEHTVLSDVLFVLLLVLAVAALAWHRTPSLRAVGVAGLLFGLATLVRVVGEPTVLAGAVFCLVTAGTLAVRLRRVLVLAVCFLVPVTAYAAWYHHEHGAWAITDASSRSLYMRTTSFVDCSQLALPDYERALCPREPLGHRLDPTDYGWHGEDTLPPLVLPDGVSTDEAMHDFAWRAIRAQPLDYMRTVARDVALGFRQHREDAYEYDTTEKWSFHKYIEEEPTERSQESYAEHGGQQLEVRQPLADFLDEYDDHAYLPGPVLLGLLALALAGLVVRRPNAPPSRPLIFLLVALGMGLVIAPDVTAEFVWRYQLPAIILVPPAAALAWARLRPQPGTTATPSTD
jgi:hypothetical protein